MELPLLAAAHAAATPLFSQGSLVETQLQALRSGGFYATSRKDEWCAVGLLVSAPSPRTAEDARCAVPRGPAGLDLICCLRES